MNSATSIKAIAHELIEALPDDTSWERLVYTLQVRQDIEAALKDSEADKIMESTELRSQLGIKL